MARFSGGHSPASADSRAITDPLVAPRDCRFVRSYAMTSRSSRCRRRQDINGRLFTAWEDNANRNCAASIRSPALQIRSIQRGHSRPLRSQCRRCKVLVVVLSSGRRQTRHRIARVDSTTCQPDSSIRISDGIVYSIVLQPTAKFVGGGFIYPGVHRSVCRIVSSTGGADFVRFPSFSRPVYPSQCSRRKNPGGRNFRALASALSFVAGHPVTGLADSFDPSRKQSSQCHAVQPSGNFAAGFLPLSPSGAGIDRNCIARVERRQVDGRSIQLVDTVAFWQYFAHPVQPVPGSDLPAALPAFWRGPKRSPPEYRGSLDAAFNPNGPVASTRMSALAVQANVNLIADIRDSEHKTPIICPGDADGACRFLQPGRDRM